MSLFSQDSFPIITSGWQLSTMFSSSNFLFLIDWQFKVALYKNVENIQYLELKAHNFAISQDTAQLEVPNERKRHQL